MLAFFVPSAGCVAHFGHVGQPCCALRSTGLHEQKLGMELIILLVVAGLLGSDSVTLGPVRSLGGRPGGPGPCCPLKTSTDWVPYSGPCCSFQQHLHLLSVCVHDF